MVTCFTKCILNQNGRAAHLRERLSPPQRHTNVAGHASWPIDYLHSQSVTARLEVFLPKLIEFLRQSGERVFPTRLLLIDRPTTIGSKHIREAADKHLGKPVVHGALDDTRGALEPFFVRNTRWLFKPVQQFLLLGLGGKLSAHKRGRLFSLGHGNLSPPIRR